MAERLFFFHLDGDVRKVSVPHLDSLSDLIPLLSSKYSGREITQEPQFWIRNKENGIQAQVTSPDEIYNGAVLEVVTHEGRPMEFNHEGLNNRLGGQNRYNPYPQGPSGFPVPDGFGAPGAFGGPIGFVDGPGPGGFQPEGPFNVGYQGGPAPVNNGRPDLQMCATHKKQRTIQNLTQQEDGTWVCNEMSQCKTQSSNQAGGSLETCSIHGKPRTKQNLEQSWDGRWICLETNRCKMGAPPEKRRRRRGEFREGHGQFPGPGYGGGPPGYGGGYGGFGPPRGGPPGYGGAFGPTRGGWGFGRGLGRGRGRGYGRGYGGGFGPRLGSGRGGYGGGAFRGRTNNRYNLHVCKIHGKPRSQNNLRTDESGGWICIPTSECK